MRLLAYCILILVLFTSTTFATTANPDMSVNGLFSYRNGTEGSHRDADSSNGFLFQEAELRFAANIDAYFRGDFILAVEKEDGEFIVEPEEAFVETLSLTDLTVRLGKFYAFWGRHNQLHTHAFPFVDAPLTSSVILGEEGLNDLGISLAYLLPAPWYMEIVLQAFSAENVGLFDSESQNDVAGIYFLKNLWDLSGDSTLELDLSYGNGRNVNLEPNHIYNVTLSYKWRPVVKSIYHSFSWNTEFTRAEKLVDETGTNLGRTIALSTWVQYQMAQRWWIQARLESVELQDLAIDSLNKYSALVGFIPTEYSGLRLQYDSIDDPNAAEKEQRVTLQLNVSMGVHPAHSY